MIVLSPEVEAALAERRPVVALETSIVAQGLPRPQNLDAALGCEDAIRASGAIPATVAVVGGRVRIGLARPELEELAASTGALKVSSRDLGFALATGRVGATTVAATARVAALAGIQFFATGGIGGVHRGHPEDESADLAELARSRVAVFCAGAKTVLDIPRTLERLETLSVPVIGYRTREFPGFYLRSSGCQVSAVAGGAEETAAILEASWSTGAMGAVIGIPPPEELEGVEAMIEQALVELRGAMGPEVTPRLLARVAELSEGRSVSVNVALVINNARVAGEVAAAFARRRPQG